MHLFYPLCILLDFCLVFHVLVVFLFYVSLSQFFSLSLSFFLVSFTAVATDFLIDFDLHWRIFHRIYFLNLSFFFFCFSFPF